MSRSKVDLRLLPDKCDHCGRCMRVCEPAALKVGPSYIYLDWRTCTQCMKCVQTCDRGAIVRHSGEASAKKAPAKRRASGAKTERPANAQAAPVAAVKSEHAPLATSKPEPASVATPKRPAPTGLPSVGPVVWSPLEALAVAAVALATFLGKDAVLGSALVAAMPDEGRIMARVAVLVLFYAVQLAVLAFFAHRRGTGLLAAFGLTRIRASFGSWLTAAGWVLLLLVATRIGAWVWGVIAQAIGIPAPSATEAGLAGVFGAGTAGLALTIMLVVLVAPLVEEMLFRGVLLSAIGSRAGAGVALVGQAILFAAYHFSAWMFVPMLLLGLACGYLTQRRASLWPAVLLHGLFNAVPVALVFWTSAG